MSRERVPQRLEGAGQMVLPSSIRNATRRCGCAFSRDSSCCGDDALRFLTQTSSVVVQCQPWFYLRLAAYSFFWLSEGAYGYSRDSVPQHWFRLTRLWILTLEPERLKNRPATACDESRDGWGSQQTLKLLVVSDVGRRNALLSSRPAK